MYVDMIDKMSDKCNCPYGMFNHGLYLQVVLHNMTYETTWCSNTKYSVIMNYFETNVTIKVL